MKKKIFFLMVIFLVNNIMAVNVVINDEYSFTDLDTNLTWQRYNDGVHRSYVEAREYCSNLVFGGRDDWRIPTLYEFQTIYPETKKYFGEHNATFTFYGYSEWLFATKTMRGLHGDASHCSLVGNDNIGTHCISLIPDVYYFNVANGGYNAEPEWFPDRYLTLCVAGNDEDEDGVHDEQDLCPGTLIPDYVPTEALTKDRHAKLDHYQYFRTLYPKKIDRTPIINPNTYFILSPYTIYDTKGCNCAQILELKKGGVNKEIKNGCSTKTMEKFISNLQ